MLLLSRDRDDTDIDKEGMKDIFSNIAWNTMGKTHSIPLLHLSVVCFEHWFLVKGYFTVKL